MIKKEQKLLTTILFLKFLSVISLILLCLAFLTSYRLTQDVQLENTKRADLISNANRFIAGSKQLTESVRAYAITGDKKHYDNYWNEVNTLKNRDLALDAMAEIGIAEDEKKVLQTMKNVSNTLILLEEKAMEYVKLEKRPSAVASVYGEQYEVEIEKIYALQAKFLAMLDARTAKAVQQISNKNFRWQIGMMLWSALVVLLQVINFLFLYKKVFKPIKEIQKATTDMSFGFFDTILDHKSEDELGSLSNSIRMLQSFTKIIISDFSNGLFTIAENHFTESLSSADKKIVGMYEYRKDIKKVFTSTNLADILGLDENEALALFDDKELFEERIALICKEIHSDDDNQTIYRLSVMGKNRYLKISSFTDAVATRGIVIDITDDVLIHASIIHERDYDILSNLYNRRAFMREMEYLFTYQKRKLKVACILLLDMDNLKRTNDIYGHDAGDRYIKAATDVLFEAKKNEHCIAGRLGGDEFVVLWYGYDNQDQILEQINTIKSDLCKTTIMVADNKEYPVSLSAGYVFYPEYLSEKSTLLHYADTAMYHAKKSGKGTFFQYSPSIESRSR